MGYQRATASTRRTRGQLRAPAAIAVASAVAGALVLAGCTSGLHGELSKGSPVAIDSSTGKASSAAGTPSASTTPPGHAVIVVPHVTTNLNPAHPVVVTVAGGTLTSVALVNQDENKSVAASTSPDGTRWNTTEDLGYSKSYRLTVQARGLDGTTSSATESLSTLSPPNMTMPTIIRDGGYSLGDRQTYGVGIIPGVHFDEPITDEAAAERALVVTTSTPVTGSWYWSDDQNVYYRPQKYWPSGTNVTISANVYGVNVGGGIFGQTDVSSSFTVGRRQVTVAWDCASLGKAAPKNTPCDPKGNPLGVDKVIVSDAKGKVIRTMNTSMGRHSGIEWDGSWINFYTMYGTYTVLEHDNPALMSSQSYGLPSWAPGGYAPERIYYSSKITTDGIYLHELNNTQGAQDGGYDVSHGCLNLIHDNAVWFYNNSMIGDPVEIPNVNNGAPRGTFNQGNLWGITWSTWLKGSAL